MYSRVYAGLRSLRWLVHTIGTVDASEVYGSDAHHRFIGFGAKPVVHVFRQVVGSEVYL